MKRQVQTQSQIQLCEIEKLEALQRLTSIYGVRPCASHIAPKDIKFTPYSYQYVQ
jgi:hypothetical protein